MRRSDRELKDMSDIIRVIRQCNVCRVAFFDEEYPYIVPLNFGMDVNGEQITLYFHGARVGKKYDLMAKNNKVCFEMDCSHELLTIEEDKNCTMNYESVIGFGTLEMVADEDKYDALCKLMEQYHVEHFEFNKAAIPATNVFKLNVLQISGKARMKRG